MILRLPMPMCESAVEKPHFARFSLQLRHISLRTSQINDRLAICLLACPGWKQNKCPISLIEEVIICNTEISFCSIVTTVTPYERHAVSNYRPYSAAFFNSVSRLTTKENPICLIGDVIVSNAEIAIAAMLLQWHTWASWCFKSPTIWLFVQQHVLVDSKENIQTLPLNT